MTPGRLCDLMMYWLLNREGIDVTKTRAMLELPPPGYTGSLKGTSWDHDAILDGYNQ